MKKRGGVRAPKWFLAEARQAPSNNPAQSIPLNLMKYGYAYLTVAPASLPAHLHLQLPQLLTQYPSARSLLECDAAA